ncbi:hypothetical protein [Streptomyces sp. NPDC050560]|uniref:hypothetical protein n=1 Tax=Streptomyces sp. NPDC050560 TaxID=3365630 RepID=UPI0037994EAE
MDQFELRRVEQRLRETLRDTALAWVLDDVDAAIAAGVPEEKILRRRTSRRAGHVQGTDTASVTNRYEVVESREVDAGAHDAPRKHGTLVIATRAMTDEERVQLLLDAVRRVLVELPEMEVASLKVLGSEPESDSGSRAVAEAVVFAPHESAHAHRGETEFRADRMSVEDRARVAELLDDMARDVRD